MAAITHVHNQHGTSWFVTYYVEGQKKRLPMVYTIEEARTQKAEYDALYPPVRSWKHKPENYAAPTHRISEPKPDKRTCCYRMHRIEGEPMHVRGPYYACQACYADFVLKEVYKQYDRPCEPTAVEIILQAEGVCLPEEDCEAW